MIKNVIVIGEHIQALGVCRFAFNAGFRPILYINYKMAVPRFSRTVQKVVLYKNGDDLVDMLLLNSSEVKDTLVIATNDEQISFLKNGYSQLSKKYYLSIDKPEITDICFDKIKTYKTAMKAGVPIPRSSFPESKSELVSIAEEIEYPVIIKPSIMYKFFNATGKKAYLCHNRGELIDNYDIALTVIPANEIIVQQYLNGGAKALYSFGAFCANGEIYGGLMANRIRQKPMDFGISTCFAISVNVPEIEESAKKILKEMKYFGFAEVEFMFDADSGEYKLIEINPRTWKWHSIARILGLNLIEMMIKYYNGEKLEPKIVRTENLAWIERVTDYYVVITETFKGRYSFRTWLKTMALKKESATWSWKDPVPGIMYLLLTPYLFFKRS